MQPNGQFTEEQKAEAYRVESMQQLMEQTSSLRSIRTAMTFFVILTIINIVLGLFAVASARNGF